MEQSEIDYSHPGSISDIKKRFNRTDYSRSIACPKNSHNKPLPPAKPLLGTATSHQPLIVRTNEQSESSSGVSSNSHFVNPFKTPDQAERHFILTTSQQQEQEMKKKGEKNTVLVNQMTRSRNTSGNGEIVRKSVSDMFDDALKTVTAVNSSSGISMRKLVVIEVHTGQAAFLHRCTKSLIFFFKNLPFCRPFHTFRPFDKPFYHNFHYCKVLIYIQFSRSWRPQVLSHNKVRSRVIIIANPVKVRV